MSRIGKKPVIIPKGIEVKVDGTVVSVKGPKGQLTKEMPVGVTIDHKDDQIVCSIPEKSLKPIRARFGLVRSLINNMVIGCSEGFTKGLQIVGVGYKAKNDSPNKITLNVGYSHPVIYESPKDVILKVDGTKVLVSGPDKEHVGQVAAEIRKVRPPKHYKDGAGIRYIGERVVIKVGKKLAA